jgi:hypothetical protein
MLFCESLAELLRAAPALLCDDSSDSKAFISPMHFICHATANALEEKKGSSIIDMTFEVDCAFADGGGELYIANTLKREIHQSPMPDFLPISMSPAYSGTLWSYG